MTSEAAMTPEAAAANLGIAVDAGASEIEAAYRRKARLTHPDRFADGSAAQLRNAATQFTRAGIARDTLLARPRAASAVRVPSGPEASRSTPAPRPARVSVVDHRERVVILAAAVALLATIAAVLVIGLTSNSGLADGAGESAPTSDPLHGLNVIRITDRATIAAHCHGASNCWLWSVASTRTCPDGIVTIDFRAHAHQDAPTELVTQEVKLSARVPSFVTASRSSFPEPHAKISRFTCS
jgi:hypothetical protein